MLIQKTWKQTSIGTKLVSVGIHKSNFLLSTYHFYWPKPGIQLSELCLMTAFSAVLHVNQHYSEFQGNAGQSPYVIFQDKAFCFHWWKNTHSQILIKSLQMQFMEEHILWIAC